MNRTVSVVGIALLILTLGACSDETASEQLGPDGCPISQVRDSATDQCVPRPGNNGPGDNNGPGNNNGPGANNGSGINNGSGENNNNGETPCEGLECQQVACETAGQTTSISGVVTIPAGTLPLPNATVYVPTSPVAPIVEGASCERCDDALSGNPLVQTTTNILGEFVLENMPAGEDIPIVIQVGKWRRQIVVPAVEPCTDTELPSTLTHLPRNRSEGDIPKIALTTGGADALECLLPKLGLDLSEFTPETAEGRVNFYRARDGSARFQDSLNGGARFTAATDWWDSLDNLKNYDIVLHSCEGQEYLSDKPERARQALQDYADLGGRVFLSHWHRGWIKEGPADFRSVANWNRSSTAIRDGSTIHINQNFEKGQRLADWMLEVGGSTRLGELQVNEGRHSASTVNAEFAQQWISMSDNHSRNPQYFSFNTPVTAPDTDQCGRVVFSDIHVSYGNIPGERFPGGCTTTEFSPQEKALVFMLFDLSSCIVPDCVRTTCEEAGDICGTIPDGCGGTLSCGTPINESCSDDNDCCGDLICRAGTCQAPTCAPAGNACEKASDCCSTLCAIPSGESTGVCISA